MKRFFQYLVALCCAFSLSYAQGPATKINKQQVEALGHKQVSIGPKQDEPHGPPPECGFEIIDDGGKVVWSGRTDAQGTVTIPNIPHGPYYVVVHTADQKKIVLNSELKQIPSIPPSPHASGVGTHTTASTFFVSDERASSAHVKSLIIETGIIVIGGDQALNSMTDAQRYMHQHQMTKALALEFKADRNSLSIVVQGG